MQHSTVTEHMRILLIILTERKHTPVKYDAFR